MWFRVDDKLPSHVKARRLRRSHPDKRRDSAPFGLWVLGGAFSDDGFVPLEVLEDWDDDAEVLADRLVAAGLWEHAEKAGEAGYRFHDWAALNPADASQSGVFGNHQRWHVGAGKPKENCPICQSEGLVPTSGANRPDDRPDIAPIIAPESLPDPNRPDPNRPDPTPKDSPALPRGTRITEGWAPSDALMDWAEKNTPNADVHVETDNFVDYWLAKTGKDATKLDWDRTWQRWMRTAESRVPAWKREPRRLADDSWDHLKRDPDEDVA